MATFDQVTIQTDHHVDVASQTKTSSQPAAGSVDNGVEVDSHTVRGSALGGLVGWGCSGQLWWEVRVLP